MNRLARHPPSLVALLCAAAATVLLFYPTLGDLQGSIVGHDYSEQYSGAWVNQWAVQSVVRDHRFPLQVDNVVSREGSVIYALSLTTALMSAPFYLVLNAAGVFNVAMVLNFLLAFGASFLFFGRVAGDRWAALPGALAFALSPYLLDHFAYGPLEGAAVGWIPLALWGVEKYRGDRPFHHGVVGALVALSFAANPYYGLFTFMAAGLLMITRREVPLTLRLRRAAAGLGLAAVLVLPMAWVMDLSFAHPRSLTPARSQRDASGFHEEYITRHGVRDLASLVLPTRGFHSRFLVHGIYLGLPLLLACGLALARVRSSRRWLWLGLLFLLVTLGGSLKVGGHLLELGGHPVPLPFRWLLLHVPPLSAVTHPFRAFPLVLLSAGAMTALLFARSELRGKIKAACLVLFCLLVTGDYLWAYQRQAPVPTAPYRVPSFYADLHKEPGLFGVLDIPVTGSDYMVGQYLLYQLRHGKLVPYNLDRGRFGPHAPDAARDFADALALSSQDYNDTRDWPREAGLFRCKINCEGAAALASMGYRYVVLHRTGHEAMDLKLCACVERCIKKRSREDSEVVVYGLPPTP